MNELKLTLESVDPVQFWGTNNEHYELIKNAFPKLKVVARGNEVKVLGDDQELKGFEQKYNQLLGHLEQYSSLTPNDVESILVSKKAQVAADNGTEKPANTGGGGEVIVFGTNGLMVKARTANQRKMVDSIGKNDVLFAIGPAGTGKTYTAVALAVRALKNKEIKRIILTRPAVEAGENLGFLPGDLKEKVDPYLRPLYDALDDMIPAEKLKTYIENRTIEIAPLAFMRGRTLDNCFVILDEAQNSTDLQLKMFLTRMGPSAKFIVTGDVTQIDLPKKQMSGLHNALRILDDIPGIEIIYLNGDDVVRHKLVKRILKAYGDIQ
ncbi:MULTISPECIES: PhoH family protein [Pedobacter]|uniref:PhoH-like protein n=1 Tax=Pedobacter heparinus (strain ATCC 13125 / DSM 2366 / CIP 104194 / JCM 7457 / NBRC 12017 / NCIMB 9290 / NRRL B-14731 / HIM 762-3) TaxID=485917 RepID=C6XVZ2_PEDHD|nr:MULTISPECIES: PhoH family protein [Pedobacter]ACU04071.1 PhoH family protein [Pedobacter heparinus DSM 2366]MBB5436476.1 phosphate starvation-inducible PhoH-like protein [Pedobacter sp. AK017]